MIGTLMRCLPGSLCNVRECLHVTLLSDQSELQPETDVAIAGWIFALCCLYASLL